MRLNSTAVASTLQRPYHSTPARMQSTYQPPNPPKSQGNPHRNFYRHFGRPVAKNFLIAVATYQVLYWSWLKLEGMETKKRKTEEMHSLEGELRKLTKGQAGP